MAYWTAKEQVDSVYDIQLVTGANVLRALMGDELAAIEQGQVDETIAVDDKPLLSAEDRLGFDAYADWRMFRIWKQGRLVVASDTGPRLGAKACPVQGYCDAKDRNSDIWRIYSLNLKEAHITVQVGERQSIRADLVRKVAIRLAGATIWVLPAGFVLIWLSLNDGLRSLGRLIRQISQRGAQDLRRISTDIWPADLAPLVMAIDGLLSRVETAKQQERTFIERAAHQLRTPLAALKVQAQMLGLVQTDAERQELMVGLLQSVDRTVNLSEQLLTLARLEASASVIGLCDLHVEARHALALLAPLATQKGVRLALDGEQETVSGDSASIQLVLSNLLSNALAFAPPGSEIRVVIERDEPWTLLSVNDEGPGLKPEDRERVFERFQRGASSAPAGAGLGLAIAQEAARTIGGHISLDARPDGRSGLTASIRLISA
jgi:signal transduction histidine kinase